YFFQQRSGRQEEESGDVATGPGGLRGELTNLGPIIPIVLYVLLLEPIGFLFSTALYIFIAMLVYGRSLVQSITYALTLSIAFFVLFYYALLAQVPMGWFIETGRLLPFLVQIRRAMGG